MKKSLLFVVIALFAGFTAKAADGDTFRIDVGDGEDKIWMTLKILSEEQKTAEVSLVENSFGTVDIPSTVTHDEVTYTVVSIGDQAFKNQVDLVKVIIPNTVTTIGVSAFEGCTALGSLDNPIVIPESVITIGVDAFKSTWWFNNTLPDGVVYINNILYAYKGEMFAGTNVFVREGTTTIVGRAFQNCTGLVSVSIPNTVTTIGDLAFDGCSGLTSVTALNETPVSITSTTFSNAANAFLHVPQGPAFPAYLAADNWNSFGNITYAPGTVTFNVSAKPSSSGLLEVMGEEYAKYYCNIKLVGTINSYDMMIMRNKMISLRSLDLSDVSIVANSYNYGTGVSEDNVFPDFLKTTGITSVVLPRTITKIGNDAFNNANLNITDIIIPASVVTIGDNAFKSSKLSTVTFEEGSQLKKVGSYAFYSCKATFSNLIFQELSQIDSYAFYASTVTPTVINCYVSDHAFTACPIKTITINGGVGDQAFSNTPVTSVTINDGSVGQHAFAGCGQLKTVVKTGLTKIIGVYAFSGCTSLESADFEASKLGEYAFNNCTNLKTVSAHVNGKSSGSGSSYCWGFHAFENCPIETLTIGKYIPGSQNDGYFYEHNAGVAATLKTLIFDEDGTIIPRDGFAYCRNVTSVTFPSTFEVRPNAFNYCNISSIDLPEGISLSDHAFSNCGLTGELILPKSLTVIPESAFSVNKLTAVKLSPYTTKIGKYAFSGNQITGIRLPSTLQTIEDYAFSNCSNLNVIYAYMPDIITIGQNTFPNYQSSTLLVPSFLYYSYYWDTNWSQFLNVSRCDLQPGDYETFYTNGDVLFASGEDRITTDIPIATLGSQGCITVEGEAQEFDTVDQTVDADYSASLIGDGEAAADNNIPMNELRVNISVAAKKWYFFCFPFDVTIAECTYPGRYAWRSYDGAVRAANGSGGWQVVSGATLSARQGYAFQSETAGTLTVRFASPTFGGNRTRDLEVHNASSAQNASWNFVGNPYRSYYDFGRDDNK